MKIRNVVISILGSAVLFASVTVNAEDGSIRLKNEAFKEIAIVNKKGEKEYKLVSPGLALPGDEVIYITTFTNIGTQNATNIVITNPLPVNSIYKAGSAFGSGTEITYSLDGGKTYDLPANLKIKNEKGELITAPPESYNAIKWIFKNSLAPNAESTVTFRSRIK